MKKEIVFALPGTMCDERIWSALHKQPLAFSLEHVPIPNGNDIAEIIHHLADTLPQTPLTLLGFSLGGYLASAFCVHYPERIKRLIVVSNSPCALPDDEIAIREQTLNWLKTHPYTGMGSQRIRSLLHRQRQHDTVLHSIIADMDLACGKAMLIQQLKSTTLRLDLSRALQGIQVPMDIIFGEEDCLITRSVIEGICANNDNKNFYQVNGAGHMLPLEAAEQLATIITSHIQ